MALWRFLLLRFFFFFFLAKGIHSFAIPPVCLLLDVRLLKLVALNCGTPQHSSTVYVQPSDSDCVFTLILTRLWCCPCDLYTPNLSLGRCIVTANPKIFKCGLIHLNLKGTGFVFGLVGGIKCCQTLQRSQPDQGLPITHYDITAWTLMLLELQCRFRRNIVTVLHCQYRGKYLIYCVLIVLSQCE